MPTGYTSIIEEKKDVTLEEFIKRCSHAFLRSDSIDEELPDEIFPSSDYHKVEYAKEKRKLKKALAMNLDEAEREAEIAYQTDRKYYEQALLEHQELKERYQGMLKQVKAWKPPTKRHQPLRKFMINQLEETIQHDCSNSWLTEPKKISAAQYKRNLIIRTKDAIKYHKENWAEEVRKAKEANEWVQALKQNLNELKS
ncbi:hypothetical protein HY837_01000 [archaeon]|nr:hypothetical protein [archaeon]